MPRRLDEIDERIIYYLVKDARNTSAPTIAEEVNVSAATIRNRINQLEEQGIIRGYHANIDYEQVEGRLTNIYECTAILSDRDRLAQLAREVPGVVNIRELMAGRRNLQIMAVGEDIEDLSRISSELANLGVEIEDENLLKDESVIPYRPFGPEDRQDNPTVTNMMRFSGDAEMASLTVPKGAPIAGMTLERANSDELIDEELLVVSIERDESILTPRGDTEIKVGDLITVFSREGVSSETLDAFRANEETEKRT